MCLFNTLHSTNPLNYLISSLEGPSVAHKNGKLSVSDQPGEQCGTAEQPPTKLPPTQMS